MHLNRLRHVIAAAFVAALALPAAAQADTVTDWNRTATSILIQFPPAGGGAPPALQINMGMVEGAVSDAVNAIERRHRPLLLSQKFDARASKEAAAAQAAYRVLSSLVADPRSGIAPALKTTMQQTLDSALAASLAPITPGAAKANGIAAGNAAADAMLAARANDGRFGPSPWVPNPAVGHWQPLINPMTGLPILDPTPWAANVQPFTIKSSSQFRTAGPNPLGSAVYAHEFDETRLLGAINSSVRTDLQTQIALFWQSNGGPAILWNDVARQLTERPSSHLDLVDTAALFGLMNLAGADAGINCWNDKYYWDFWRPWNAIPRAGDDGNDATDPDAGWAALLTAPYPEHPSGHMCFDGALLGSLRMFLGTDTAEFTVTSSRAAMLPLLPNPRPFSSFSAPLAEIIEARIWAGLHWRTADVQGLQLGLDVAKWTAHHYFAPFAH
jgi:hypothetical protein